MTMNELIISKLIKKKREVGCFSAEARKLIISDFTFKGLIGGVFGLGDHKTGHVKFL